MLNLSKQDYLDGQMILVDKPKNWTSFDVVAKIRNLLKIKKIGHSGTLDPLATGLMILCTGKMTKKLNYLQDESKEYLAEFSLGGTTASYDLETPIENLKNTDFIKIDEVKEGMAKFTGNIQQLPPIYSAIKINGKKAYEYARKGKDINLQPRDVYIGSFELIEFEHPERITAKISCSKGTYIRSLIHDLGQHLEVGAYLKNLRRTKIGNHDISQSYTLDFIIHYLKNEYE